MTPSDNIDVQHLKQFENMLFGERIAYIIEIRGISKAWIAERLGISKQALNYLLKHSIKPKFIDEFAELLGLDPQWIEDGLGDPFVKKIKAAKSVSLPVFNHENLHEQTNVTYDMHQTIDFTHNSDNTFLAYKLEDDSNFPPFIGGSILIFNTEKKPANQDYILLKINREIFVRQYLIDGDNICFKASNSLHKTFINPLATILGVLVEVRYKLN
jgi:SOS-response transcriptional repressor LexA